VSKPECPACGDTGFSERLASECPACIAAGRQPLRDALASLFKHWWGSGRYPSEEDAVEVVRWAYRPAVTYVVIRRWADGTMDVLSRYTPVAKELLEHKLRSDNEYARLTYIAKAVKGDTPADTSYKPIARWRGGRWLKRSKGASK